jgi:hypothetical protein
MNNVHGDHFIASDQLTSDSIPARATNWGAVTRFAATFDARSELPAGAGISGVADIGHASSIPEMRLAIYCEWRRYNHRGYEPESSTIQQTQYVLDQIRLAIHPEKAHLVFLRSGNLLIVKRPNVDWRQLQDDYEDFMTSLGPWTATEIASYFSDDYTDDDNAWPFSIQVLSDFFSSPDKTEIAAK